MSEETKCEVCETTARRRRGRLAPETGWYCELDCDGEKYIFWVCSDDCREKAVVWRRGPGVLDLNACPKCDRPLGINRPVECVCGFKIDGSDDEEYDDGAVTARERACLNGAHVPEEEEDGASVRSACDNAVVWHRDLQLPLKLCKYCRNVCVPRG